MEPLTLPHAIDMERATLGAVLLNRDAMVNAAAILPSVEDFYDQRNAQIWGAMLECFERRTPPDVVMVVEELRRRGQLESTGGAAALMELTDACPSSYHVLGYAQAVADAAARRRAIAASGTIARLAYDESIPVPDLHSRCQAEVDSALVRARHRQGASLADIMNQIYEQQKLETHPGILCGYRDLDHILGGLQRSDLLILAARPAVGKTSLAMGMAEGVAEQGGHAQVFSLEMSAAQLGQRMIAGRSGVDTHRLRTRQLRDAQLPAVMEAMSNLSRLNIRVEDNAAVTVADVRALALREASINGPLDLIVIDYLQLMQGGGRRGGSENRVQEVSEISRGLKALARELDVPILALSQLSRAVEGRTSKVPMLSDLRESGSLEQDADVVLFIYREELYEPETDKKGVAEIHIAKHRNGPVGVVPMRFDPATTRFSDLTYRTVEGY